MTVQAPVKEQQPDGMSHRGWYGGWEMPMCSTVLWTSPTSRAMHALRQVLPQVATTRPKAFTKHTTSDQLCKILLHNKCELCCAS